MSRTRNLFSAALLASSVLLDQTMAVVGHRVITLSEARGEAFVSSVVEDHKAPDATTTPEQTERALQTIVRRALIDNYLDNLGLVQEVPPERKAALKNSLKPYLSSSGISEQTLDRLLTSRIRSEIFAESHLPFRVNVTEEEVQRYYEAEKDRRFLRKPFESVAPIVRADLRRERVKKELEKWLETETHRTQVVFLNR
jgi:hypothetical protein